jgi:hypothetical protein
MAIAKFDFAGKGMGELLSGTRLLVPPNQRSYAWRERHVTELLQDLNGAIQHESEDYFLGTIVLIANGDETPFIADGQQRLATTSIILARIRDAFHAMNRPPRAKHIDDTFLRKIDIDSETVVPQVSLNVEDNEYFRSAILRSPKDDSTEPVPAPGNSSNRRLFVASNVVRQFFDGLLQQLPVDLGADYLVKWVRFLHNKATVVVVTVPDEVGAYRIFETLNDRGLRASQADILKNYFLSRAGHRVTEAHGMWNGMAGAIGTVSGDKDDHVIRYIRTLWIMDQGPIREKDVADSIKKNVTGEMRSMQFVHRLQVHSADYVALWSGADERWKGYKNSTTRYLATLTDHLKVEQIRPLLFAVAIHFTPEETDKAFRLFVSWSVRFLIAGGGRGGTLDKHYGDLAKAVGAKGVTKARELREALREFVPTDRDFESAFSTARVAKTYLRRYYLRTLDRQLKEDPQPEYVANEDETEINVEHVSPVTSARDDDDDEFDESLENLLGNMVLIKARLNTAAANLPPLDKMDMYKHSEYLITRQAAEYQEWGIDQIRDRQAKMAKIAIKAWSLSFVD